jgi:hypothetical protein
LLATSLHVDPDETTRSYFNFLIASTKVQYQPPSGGFFYGSFKMKKLAFAALLAPALAFGQALPSPTFSSLTLQNPLTAVNGGTGASSSTGTGSVVLSNSATLVTPNLGTPSSVTLTNGTGLPVSTGISGLGTGVATALGTAATGSGGVVLSASPTISGATVTGSFTATGLVTTTDLAAQAANTVLANATGSTANITAFAMPSCSTSTSALQYTSGVGFSCYTNSASLTGATFTGAITAPGITTSGNFLGSGTGYSIGNTTGLSSGSALQLFDATHGNNFSVLVGGSQVANFTSTGINNAAVGATTPGTGAFTSLSASGAVSGVGFSTYLASPPAIGGAAPAAGSFTSLSASSSATAPTLAVGTNTTGVATSAFVAAHDPCPSILDYGGSNAGSIDNTTAFANTIAASPSGQACVYFPAGKYAFASAITYAFPSATSTLIIEGASAETTQLVWSAGGGLTLSLDGTYTSFHVRNLTLATGTTGSGTALTVNEQSGAQVNPGNQALSDVTNVSIRGSDAYAATHYWTTGIYVSQVSQINFEGVNIFGPSAVGGSGVSLNGASAAATTVFNFHSCVFNYLTTGISYGTYVQGVTVNQSNFTGGAIGINVAASESGLDQLAVTGSQFENTSVGISASSYVPDSLIENNLFIVPAGAIAVQLSTSGLFSMVGNSIHGLSTSSTNGFVIANSQFGGAITGNSIYNVGTGIYLQSTSNGVNVQSNVYHGNSANVVNSGGAVCPATASGNCLGGGSE